MHLPKTSTTGIQKSKFAPTKDNKDKAHEGNVPQKVLLIDDDVSFHEEIQSMLEGIGYTVLHAFNGKEGLNLAIEHEPSVIVLDIVMPIMDGLSTLSALKSDTRLADIPVIIVSIIDEKELGFALGSIDFVHKPINKNELVNKISTFLSLDDKSHTVLIVDDDAAARDLMCKAVDKVGWKSIQAVNGRDAMEKLNVFDPSIILLDLLMPEMDGFTVINELQKNEKWRKIPVIVVTAKELTQDERTMLTKYTKVLLQKGSYTHKKLITTIYEQIKYLTGHTGENQ